MFSPDLTFKSFKCHVGHADVVDTDRRLMVKKITKSRYIGAIQIYNISTKRTKNTTKRNHAIKKNTWRRPGAFHQNIKEDNCPNFSM